MTTDNTNSRLPVPTQGDSDTPRTTVITPEIVDDSAQGQRRGQQGHGGFYTQTGDSSGSGFTYTTWSSGAGMGAGMGSGGLVARDGCLPAMITILLTGVCAVQWGVLAAISFVVFYVLASGMSFMLRLRNLMQGRNINPWVFRIVSWVGAGILVAWLSDAF